MAKAPRRAKDLAAMSRADGAPPCSSRVCGCLLTSEQRQSASNRRSRALAWQCRRLVAQIVNRPPAQTCRAHDISDAVAPECVAHTSEIEDLCAVHARLFAAYRTVRLLGCRECRAIGLFADCTL